MGVSVTSLLDRLGARFKESKSHWIQIGAGEVAIWPTGVFVMIEPFLTPDEPARTLECDGCEEACFQPVHVYPQDGNRAAVAFIACDQREDAGRIKVDFARLRQWRLTRESFERFKIQNVLPHDAEPSDKPRKTRAPKAFQEGLRNLLIEIGSRTKAKGLQFSAKAMPGRKIDFKALADKWDESLDVADGTFGTYLKGICTFKRGAREVGFYRDLFPEYFK